MNMWGMRAQPFFAAKVIIRITELGEREYGYDTDVRKGLSGD